RQEDQRSREEPRRPLQVDDDRRQPGRDLPQRPTPGDQGGRDAQYRHPRGEDRRPPRRRGRPRIRRPRVPPFQPPDHQQRREGHRAGEEGGRRGGRALGQGPGDQLVGRQEPQEQELRDQLRRRRRG